MALMIVQTKFKIMFDRLLGELMQGEWILNQ